MAARDHAPLDLIGMATHWDYTFEISRIPWYPLISHVIPCCLCFIVNCLWICHVPIFMLFLGSAGWLTCSPSPSAASWVSHQTTSGSCCGTNFVPAAELSWRRDGRPNHRCSSTDCWLTFPHSSELPYPRAILPYAIFGRFPDSQTLYDMILVDIPISLHLLMTFLFSNWFMHSLGNNKPTAKTSSFSAQKLNPSHPWGHPATSVARRRGVQGPTLPCRTIWSPTSSWARRCPRTLWPWRSWRQAARRQRHL